MRWIIIIITDHFFIVLFYPLEQTHCAHVTCDSEIVTVSFYSPFCFSFFFLNIHLSNILTVLFCSYMAGAMQNCCHLSAHYNRIIL